MMAKPRPPALLAGMPQDRSGLCSHSPSKQAIQAKVSMGAGRGGWLWGLPMDPGQAPGTQPGKSPFPYGLCTVQGLTGLVCTFLSLPPILYLSLPPGLHAKGARAYLLQTAAACADEDHGVLVVGVGGHTSHAISAVRQQGQPLDHVQAAQRLVQHQPAEVPIYLHGLGKQQECM